MVDGGIHAARGRIRRNNTGSKMVEDVVNLMQKMIRRMYAFELAQ